MIISISNMSTRPVSYVKYGRLHFKPICGPPYSFTRPVLASSTILMNTRSITAIQFELHHDCRNCEFLWSTTTSIFPARNHVSANLGNASKIHRSRSCIQSLSSNTNLTCFNAQKCLYHRTSSSHSLPSVSLQTLTSDLYSPGVHCGKLSWYFTGNLGRINVIISAGRK
jgi:hypothetical protein